MVRAIWWVTSQKNGASALGVQRILGLGSYETAWTWLHKLRRAMVRPERDKLSGSIQVDETYIGGEKPGRRGRGAMGKTLVVIAAQEDREATSRIRLKQVSDASAESLEGAVLETIEPGSVIKTDGWDGYNGLRSLGYKHKVIRARTRAY
jgi:transposase-like protein